MFDDPHSYDLSEFAVEFTWSLLFWNSAEQVVRQIVAELIGRSSASALALAMDLGNLSIVHALESASREDENAEFREHIEHLKEGFETVLAYRNAYVHGLNAVVWDDPRTLPITKIYGHSINYKGKGRLRALERRMPVSEINKFKTHCLKLQEYSRAIMFDITGHDEWDLAGALGMPQPSLEKPIWPEKLQNTPHYLQ